MTALRRAAGVAIALTFCLIVLGAWVRATGSGLACPDWPTCYGHWLPLPGEIPDGAGYSYVQVMLEWLHRLLAGVVLGPLILLIGGLAWRVRAERPAHAAYAAALVLLLLVQAGARRPHRARPEQPLVGRAPSRHGARCCSACCG